MQAPERQLENGSVYDDLISITNEVEEKIKSGDLTYDDYMEIQIKYFKGKDNDFLRSHIRENVDTANSATNPNTWNKANSVFDAVKNVDINYPCLLTDPLIIARYNHFLSFIKDKPLQNPSELRKNFINTFPTKTYYRGVVLSSTETNYPNAHLAPIIRKLVQNETDWLTQYRAEISNTKTKIEKLSKDRKSYSYLYNTPLLYRFAERITRHVGSKQTKSEVISITEYPEIAWYIPSHNSRELWRHWDKKTFLRMYKFNMNSFYAPSTIDLVWSKFDSYDKNDARTINFSNSAGDFEVSVLDPKIEQLVPISLPKDFDKDYRDYRPEWDETGFRTKSFTFPRETDWK